MPKLYSSSTYVTISSNNSPFAAIGGSSIFTGDGLMSFEEAAAVASRVTSNLHTDGQTDDSSSIIPAGTVLTNQQWFPSHDHKFGTL